MANSLSLEVELLPPGRPKAEVSTERLPNGDIRVNWARAADIVFYRVKRGPAATTDCDDHSGYRLLRSQSVVIAHASLPLKLCSVAIDVIRQSSEFRTDLLEANVS